MGFYRFLPRHERIQRYNREQQVMRARAVNSSLIRSVGRARFSLDDGGVNFSFGGDEMGWDGNCSR